MEGEKKMIKQIRVGDIIKNCFDDLILVMRIERTLIYGMFIEYSPEIRVTFPRVMLDYYEKVENIFDRRKNNEN